MTAHCIDLVLDEKRNLEQRIPAYGGLLSIICPERRPQMATVAKGVFPTPEPDETRSGDIVALSVPDTVSHRIKTLEIVREEPEGLELESADIVVAGGAGAGGLVGWNKIDDLANTLNGALGLPSAQVCRAACMAEAPRTAPSWWFGLLLPWRNMRDMPER